MIKLGKKLRELQEKSEDVTTDCQVEKQKTVDVSNLSDTQIDAVRRIIAEFNQSNK